MSLLEEQLEEIRKQMAAVGVTPEMASAAPVSGGLLGIEPPKHWTEEVIERDGKGKFFGKMLLGGFTGLGPLLFPESIGAKDRYRAELASYYEKMQDAQERQILNNIDMSNPTMSDIAMMPTAMQDFASDVYRGNQGGYLAEQAELAGMSYADFMALSPEMRRWHIRQNASDEERASMDFMAGRQTPEQKAAEAGMVAGAQAQAKADVEKEQVEESRAPQIQDAFDITTELLDDDSYRGLYGAIDGRTPTVLPESLNAKAKLERLSNILYMFARGELKGQGQVTEQEAEAARSAASTINNFLQGDDQAQLELMRLNKQFGGLLGLDENALWVPREQRNKDKRWRVVTDGNN